jgi:hypothetical protein
MNTRYLSRISGLAAAVFLIVLSGCTALNTFPQAARSGDTVALSVGSPDGMTRANTTAAFFSDSQPGVAYDLTSGIRGVFRLYADKASGLYTNSSNTRSIIDTSGHEPWLTVLVVDLPQSLPIGSGKVHITTTATYPTIGSHINDLPVNLEIIPGTGTTSDLPYEFGLGAQLNGDLTLLETQPYALVAPAFPQSTTWPAYGAIEMKLHVPTSEGTALAPPALRVVVDDMTGKTSSGLSALSRHDNNQDLTVMLMSPTGKLRYYEPRFSIVLVDNENQSIAFSETPVISSVSYFDINGNEVAGPLASSYTVQMR